MKLHKLRPASGSTKNGKRIARGQGSGKGGTATRGHKGAQSRSGYSRKRNFEGGQMPLQMRLPKRGFKNPNRTAYVPMNLERIQEIVDKYNIEKISPEWLAEKRIVRKNARIKVLGTGELKTKIEIAAHACSNSAKEAIEKLGGSVNLV